MKNKILLKKGEEAVNLEQFAGEWVALIGNKIVGHDKTLEGLMKNIENRPLKKKPSVLLVPRNGEGPYVL